MRSAIIFLLGALAMAVLMPTVQSAVASKAAFRFVERNEWVNGRSDYDQITYLEGMSDALTFVSPEDAIGPALSNCFRAAKLRSGLEIYPPLLDELKTSPPSELLPEVLMRVLRKACKDYLK